MMDKRLECALNYAKKGWPVFPVGNNKLPAIKQWEKMATTSAEQIKNWFDTMLIGGCNFGFTPGRADIAVIDVDVNKELKNGGTVNGEDSLAAYCKEMGGTLPETFTVRTPSGGKHYYFKTPKGGVRSQNAFLPAVDVKAGGGYVVAAGAENAAGGLYVVEKDVACATLPQWFIDAYGRAGAQKKANSEMPISYRAKITADTPEKIEDAVSIIENWQYADEGERNTNLFQLSRELCRAGISLAKAEELYAEYGIDHIGLDPDSYEVRATMKSAYTDMSDFGIDSEEGRMGFFALFDELPDDEDDAASGAVSKSKIPFGVDWTELEARNIPERRWFVENWLSADEGYTVLFSGRGGVGKSGLVLDLARSLATGADWCGMKVKRGAKTMYVSCEDSEEEIARRIQKRLALDGSAVPQGVVKIVSRLGRDNLLCSFDNRSGKLKTEKFYHELKNEARAFFGIDGGVLVLDTLADIYGANENDRTQVSTFVKYLLGRLGRDLGVTIIVLAHPAKGTAIAGQGFSGSTAWEGAFRCRWELNYRREGDVSGLLEFKLAKSNTALAGEKVILSRKDGAFYVVDEAEADDIIPNMIMEAIDCAYEEGNPYGWHPMSSRPITTGSFKDPITGYLLSPKEISDAVGMLLKSGNVEIVKQGRKSVLRLI